MRGQARPRYVALGLTRTFADVFDNFLAATAELGRGSRLEALDDHLDRIERLHGLRVVS